MTETNNLTPQQRLELVKLTRLYPKQAKVFYQHAKYFGLSPKNYDWWVWECLWAVHIEGTEYPHELNVEILCYKRITK